MLEKSMMSDKCSSPKFCASSLMGDVGKADVQCRAAVFTRRMP